MPEDLSFKDDNEFSEALINQLMQDEDTRILADLIR